MLADGDVRKAGRGAAFVGREVEFSELAGGLEEAIEGRGRGFLVLGEPGIGKTRLAAELAEHATAAGALVLWGRCWEAGGAPPYWPWTEVLRTAADDATNLALPPQLIALLPRAAPSEAVGADPGAERFAVFESVSLLLRRLSASQPVLVVIDDLHAADLPSMLLLEHLLSSALRQSGVTVVALAREQELFSSADASAALRIRRLARTIRLAGLARAEVAALVHQRVGSSSDAVVDAVLAATEGNPLFVEELAALIADTTSAQPLAPLPAGVRETIRQRYELLPEDVRALLRVAAVIGREFDLDLLAVASRRDDEDVLTLVDTASRQGVVASTAARRYRFGHILVRDVLYDELPAAERANLHAKVAKALQHRHGTTHGDNLDAVAHHLVAALPTVDHALVIEALVRAGAHAEARLAYELAAAQYDRALAIAEAHGGGEDELACDLLLRVARADEHGGRTERAKEALRRAVDVARKLGDPVRLGHAAIGLSERVPFQQRDDATIDFLEEALGALPESEPALQARLLAATARLRAYAGKREDLEETAAAAVAAARRVDDPSALAEALTTHLLTLWRPDRVRDRLTVAIDVLKVADQARDRERALEAHMAAMICHLELGDGPAFDRSLAAYAGVAEELRQPRHRFVAMTRSAMRHLICGRLSEGRALADAARRLGNECGEPDAEPVHHGLLALPARDDGVGLDEVERFFVSFSSRHTSVGSRALLALFALERHDDAAARRYLAELVAGIDELPMDMDWLLCVSAAAACAHRLSDAAAAAELYPRLVPFEDRCAVVAGAIGFAGSVAHYLALLALTLGRAEDAARHFGVATATHEALGARPWVARTRAEQSAALGDGASLRRGPSSTAIHAMLRREGDRWSVRYGATSFALADGRGVQHLAVLLGRPGQEVHALELVAGAGGAVASGDAGPVLDERAKAAYRRRVRELQEELDEAAAWNDDARRARLEDELDAVTRELAAAVGLHGRDRRAASGADRARVSVRKAIVRTLREIAVHDADLARYLETTIRTGAYCAYEPDSRFPVIWEL